MSIDPEKLPDSMLRKIIINGVRIESRYHKSREIKEMAEFIKSLGDSSSNVTSIFCDSKACAMYDIEVTPNIPSIQQFILDRATSWFLTHGTGYNGIRVGDLWADAEWNE